jgi:tRNA nucleotidyltransferase/poly(A) polymerase
MLLTPQAALPPFVHSVLNEIHRLCSPVYLAGESLRECLMNETLPDDLELLVPRPVAECRQRLLQSGLLPASTGSIEMASPQRIVIPLKRSIPPRTIEIVQCTSNIVEHLRVRDITINAMAWSWPDGPIIDPYAGLQDLASRSIRLIHPRETLEKDPLNALRFFRFLLQLAGKSEAEQLYQVRHVSLSGVARDRMRAEVDQIFSLPLQDEASRRLLRDLFDAPLGKTILPELVTLKQTLKPAPITRGPAAGTTTVIATSPATSPDCCAPISLWEYAMRTMLAVTIPEEDEAISLLDLRWAALLYEIGNGLAQAADGASSSPESTTSAASDREQVRAMRTILPGIMDRLYFSRRRQRRIRMLLQHIALPLSISPRALRRMIQRNIPVEGVLRLIRARLEAQGCSSTEKQAIDREYLQILQQCRQFRDGMNQMDRCDLALTGGDIADVVRLPAGPWLQALQRELVLWVGTDMRRNKRDLLQEQVREWIIRQPRLTP